MTNHPIDAPPDKTELRRKAEGVVDTPESMTAQVHEIADAKRLLYELQVYRAELEMQNEELKRTKDELLGEKTWKDSLISWLAHSASETDGETFFNRMARFLAQSLEMDFVCIDRLSEDRLQATTLAVWHNGHFEDNITYTLADTPCGAVVGKEVCCFPSGVSRLFPKDLVLQGLRAESYVGVTLWSHDHKPIGLIAVIGRQPLARRQTAEGMLNLIGIRAAGEIERQNALAAQQQLHEQLLQSQKLESLGVLAGGIAHDFNNILAIITNYCAVIEKDYASAPQLVPEIRQAALRAAGLCQQMLTYAGKGECHPAPINFSELVNEMIKMLVQTIGKNIGVSSTLANSLPPVNGDINQLRQLVMNLIINAAEAIGEDQGTVRVMLNETTIVTGQHEYDSLSKEIPAGHYLCLTVSDSGCGMDSELQRCIFEPFFSTKFSGRGLGLSAVLGIIGAHGGAMQLSSQPGQGTTFKVYLPASHGELAEVESSQPVASEYHGLGTILLVEDEPQLQMTTKLMLEDFGFSVITANNGKEALELYRQQPAGVALVFTDLGMPVMDGYELVAELRRLGARQPIIISTGFGDTEVYSRISRDAVDGVVSKPYTFEKLVKLLCEALPESLH